MGDEAVAIVKALAACDPIAVDCQAWCPLCAGGGADDEDVHYPEYVVHKPDCPWVRAKAYVEANHAPSALDEPLAHR